MTTAQVHSNMFKPLLRKLNTAREAQSESPRLDPGVISGKFVQGAHEIQWETCHQVSRTFEDHMTSVIIWWLLYILYNAYMSRIYMDVDSRLYTFKKIIGNTIHASVMRPDRLLKSLQEGLPSLSGVWKRQGPRCTRGHQWLSCMGWLLSRRQYTHR